MLAWLSLPLGLFVKATSVDPRDAQSDGDRDERHDREANCAGGDLHDQADRSAVGRDDDGPIGPRQHRSAPVPPLSLASSTVERHVSARMIGGSGPPATAGDSLIAPLSELAARVQRGRSANDVLRIAGDGLTALGMRFGVFELEGTTLVLRHVATAPERLAAIEAMIGRPVFGLRAPVDQCAPAAEVVEKRRNIYKEDHDLFDRFLRAATGHDIASLDAAPSTAGVSNGVLAPIFVRDRPWGLLTMVGPVFRAADAQATGLFATHVGSAIEVAQVIETLERTNIDLSRTQRELIERERLAALGELAAMIAHEVRNPIGTIFNALGFLRRLIPAEDPRNRDASIFLGIVGEEAERLNRIVSDMLDLAKPTNLRTEDLRIDDVVGDVLEAAACRPEAAAVEVRVEIAADLPVIAMDARLMRQALFNVVLNALQAMPRGGSLTVCARSEQRGERPFARIEVSDAGDGIRTGDVGRIFEPFYTTKLTGTGLGLPLVKRIVEAHRGEVTVHSSASGTTFALHVPAGGAAAHPN